MNDALGNVIGLVNSTGGVTDQYQYSPFGVVEQQSLNAYNNIRWKGLLYDSETGLYHMRARDYSPDLGRFISEDPAGIMVGPNQYTFANNDPVNGSDPSGLVPWWEDLTIGCVWAFFSDRSVCIVRQLEEVVVSDVWAKDRERFANFAVGGDPVMSVFNTMARVREFSAALDKVTPRVCGGGAFSLAGKSFHVPKTKIEGEAYVVPIGWDSSEGLFSGGLALANLPIVGAVGFEGAYSWRNHKTFKSGLAAQTLTQGKKVQGGIYEAGAFETGGTDGITVGGYVEGDIFGGGAYANISIGPCH